MAHPTTGKIGGVLLLAICLVAVAPNRVQAKKAKKQFTVAVMAFQNASGNAEYDSLGLGLQSMITTDLAQVQALELVERARLNEVLAEHKLAKSRLTDKRRVVKLGKLVGATHLLGGSFIIQGGKMRIDARLVAARTGRVVLAEKAEGEKDAFFELEKQLVNRVISSLGAKPTAKERAKVAKIHTAEFKAFKAYSQGVSQFDAKRYDDALKSLRAASELDEDFKLARLTLGEYERVITRIRERATSITSAEEQLKRLKKEKSEANLAEVTGRLFAIAGREGKKNAIDRATALYLLREDFNPRGARIDIFAIHRLQASIWRRYLNEAIDLYPKLPFKKTGSRGSPFRHDAANFDAQFAIGRKDVLGRMKPGYGVLVLPKLQRMRWAMGISQRKAITLFSSLLSMVTKTKLPGPDATGGKSNNAWRAILQNRWEDKRREHLLDLAHAYRAILDLDSSTAILMSLSAKTAYASELKRLALEVAANRDLRRAQAGARNKGVLAEYLRSRLGNCRGHKNRLVTGKSDSWKLFQASPISMEAVATLNRGRAFCSPQFIGGHALWQNGTSKGVQTGPKNHVDEADEFRYYKNKASGRAADRYEMSTVVDGLSRDELRASFSISYTPARDWWPNTDWSHDRLVPNDVPAAKDPRIIKERPELGFFFSVKDVKVRWWKHRDTQKKKLPHPYPMHGFMVQFTEEAVRLVRIREHSMSDHDRYRKFKIDMLQEKKANLGADRLDVQIRIDPKAGQVIVNVNKKRFQFKLKGIQSGFYGFHARGEGYAGVGKLSIR